MKRQLGSRDRCWRWPRRPARPSGSPAARRRRGVGRHPGRHGRRALDRQANVEAGGKKWATDAEGDGSDPRRPGVRGCREDRCRFHRRRRFVDRRIAAAVQGVGRRRLRHGRHAQDHRRRRLGGRPAPGRDADTVRVDLFDFELPEERIALRPAEPRDAARLLVVRPGDGVRGPASSATCRTLLEPGDVLVFNDTKVIPAQLSGVRRRGDAVAQIDATLHQADRAGSLVGVRPAGQAARGRRPHPLRP